MSRIYTCPSLMAAVCMAAAAPSNSEAFTSSSCCCWWWWQKSNNGRPIVVSHVYGGTRVPSSSRRRLRLLNVEKDNGDGDIRDEQDDEQEEVMLQGMLSDLNSLQDLLLELEEDNDDGNVDETEYLDKEAWMDLFGSTLPEDIDFDELAELEQQLMKSKGEESALDEHHQKRNLAAVPTESLESALLQGVVPANAGVGSGSLPGDYGFDPWNLATKDYIGKIQRWIWNRLPTSSDDDSDDEPLEHSTEEQDRPQALVLRDYREAEIRHGRLAMLAAVLWPLQQLLDRLLLDEEQFGSTTIVYGGVTLPYLSLFMTAVMLLLGYLDIYANVVKNVDAVGEAFLPGDCFWDPLKMLDGAPSTMKRNMQERELFNGRMAMLAVAVYFFEEFCTHKPLIVIPGNELLFTPAYQVPYIQQWLDGIFAA